MSKRSKEWCEAQSIRMINFYADKPGTFTGHKHTEASNQKNRESHLGKPTKKRIPREVRLCKCGCGETFEWRNDEIKEYKVGHSPRETRRKELKDLAPTIVQLNKDGVSTELLAIECCITRRHLEVLMLAIGYKPLRRKTGPKVGELLLPRETRKCQCSPECNETFECLPSDTRKYLNKEHRSVAMSLLYSGSNGSNWKGGITPLYTEIRNIKEYTNWRNSIYRRDDYTCQDCRSMGKYIEAHHSIKPFHIILKDFLKHYSQFSPIEEKEILVRLSTTWEPFWDLNNGITLCKECHDKKGLHKWSET